MKNKDINFEYIDEFVDYILDKVVDNEDLFISVIAKFDSMKEVVMSILSYGNADFDKLELTTPLINEYEDEYVLELFWEDGFFEFRCMPLKVNGKYENPCGDETYLFDDCSSKIVPLCDGSELYYVSIDDKCNCNEECNNNCCDCCDDEPYAINVKVNLNTDDVKKVVKKYYNNFYKEIIELLDL